MCVRTLRVYASECVFTDICPVSTSICEDLGCLHGSSFVDLCRASSPSWFDGSESKLWNTLAFFCMLVSYRALRILQLAWGVWMCAYTLMWAQEYTYRMQLINVCVCSWGCKLQQGFEKVTFEGNNISMKGPKGVRERAQFIKMLADKPDDLIQSHDLLNGKRESIPFSCPLTPTHAPGRSTPTHVHTHTPQNN